MPGLAQGKLALLTLAGTLILALLQQITAALPWNLAIDHPQTLEGAIVVSTIVAAFCLFRWFWAVAPAWYDDAEDEILEELTVHGQSEWFRPSWLVGLLVFFGLGFLAKLNWLTHLGLILGGCFLWLYFVDVLLEVYENKLAGLCSVATDFGHALRMIGSGLAISLLSISLSLVCYGSLGKEIPPLSPISRVPPANHPPIPPKPLTRWEEFQQWVKDLSIEVEDSLKSTPLPAPTPAPAPSAVEKRTLEQVQEKIRTLVEQMDPATLEAWIRQLRAQKNSPEVQRTLDQIAEILEKKKP